LHEDGARRAGGDFLPGPDDWHRVVETASLGIWVLDERSVTTFASGRMAELLGYGSAELVGRLFEDFVLPEEMDDHRARVAEAHAGRSASYQRRLRRKDGRTLWAVVAATPRHDAEGRFTGTFALVTDVSERVKSEAAQARFLQILMDAMPHPVYYKDRGGKYLGCNKAFEKTMGLAKDRVVGKTVFDVFPGPNAARAHEMDEALLASSGVQFYESDLQTHSGAGGPALFQKATFEGADGTVAGIIGSIVDLTDLKRVETDVRQLNDELEARVRDRTHELLAANRELESFAYSVSHDLRAPLRAIASFSQLVQAEGGTLLPDGSRGYLERVVRAAQKLSRLIDTLLGLHRIARQEIHPQPFDLSAAAGEIARELLAGQPGRSVDLVVAEGLQAEGDPELLRILLRILLDNALKFTSTRERPHVEIGAATGIPPGETGERRVYFVRDNGAGFDMAYADKLFGPFQRLHTEAEFPGSGIGLATAQRIVHRHGGTIWAEAAPERGATFSFTLGGTRA
jgi:PAS domain S-box-containing protein